jgi:2-oxoglutarate ferredoxin oxidoreductase subunit alpha
VTVVIAGEAGQGIQTVEYLLAKILKSEGYHIFASKEYMSRIRGGANSTAIRVSSARVAAYAAGIDLLVALDREAPAHLADRLSPATIIVGDAAGLGLDRPVLDIPFAAIAAAAGNKLFANSVASGAVAGLFQVDFAGVERAIAAYFRGKPQAMVDQNIAAARTGYEAGRELAAAGRAGLTPPDKDAAVAGDPIINGSEALALGAVAGGCNFIASYPMSPGTGVLIYLSQFAADFGIVAEQAEDEIAAINMGLGAWYAGARAMVSTSGGGFALMTEAVSLAGMIESPMVIHIAGRPGPATGLPTRTEQGDLELALYAGHGEFPRLILAPRSIDAAFYRTAEAFQLADRFQVPVFILTDQFLVDSFLNLPELDPAGLENEPRIVATPADYRRYELTPDGLSPRGIPGHGAGLVGVDSDEHDEAGHITEDLELRVRMVDKRLRKLELLRTDLVPPLFHGPADYRTLVVGWGSTYPAIREALAGLDRPDVAQLHLEQVYPLPPSAVAYLQKAERIILVENNATGQFGKLLRQETGRAASDRILKYNGMPFAVEELAERFAALLTADTAAEGSAV